MGMSSSTTYAQHTIVPDRLRGFLDFVASHGLTTATEAQNALGRLELSVVRRAAAEGLVARRAGTLEGTASATDEFFLTPAGAAYVHLNPDEFPWPFRG